jgi:hypothetical protein
MITMKDPTLTVYPNRQQMLALIQARSAADAQDGANEPSSAASDREFETCIFVLADSPLRVS